jgi:serine/threonine-protein kinase HipA
VKSTCDVAIALEAHAAYGLTSVGAKDIVSKTLEVVASWRSEAARLRIPKAEQELMAKAFSSKDTH